MTDRVSNTSDALVSLICGEATCDVGCGSGQERKRLCVRLAKKIACEGASGDRRSGSERRDYASGKSRLYRDQRRMGWERRKA